MKKNNSTFYLLIFLFSLIFIILYYYIIYKKNILIEGKKDFDPEKEGNKKKDGLQQNLNKFFPQ